MKYLFVLTFIGVYGLFDTNLGYATGSPLYTHLTFIFQHANIPHLITNSFAFMGVWLMVTKCVNKWFACFGAMTSTVLASFLAVESIPTVGASGMIYAMIGMYVAATSIYARISKPKSYLLFLLGVACGLIISRVNPSSNFLLHAFSLLIGCALVLNFHTVKSVFKTIGA